MHEMGIAQQVINIAVAAIPVHLKDPRVEQINLRIGKLSGVVPQSLLFHMEILSRKTPLEGATVHIEEVPAVTRCRTCLHEWPSEEAVFGCPKCESGDLILISGREFAVVSIDMADKEDMAD